MFVGAWADRPAANSLPVGTRIVATDIGTHGHADFFTDGTYWRPRNGAVCLSVLGADVDGTAATGDQVLGTVDIPAGLWTPGGRLRIILAMDKSGVTEAINMQCKVGTEIISNIVMSTSFRGTEVILQVKALSDVSVQRTGANNLASAIPLGTGAGNVRPAAFTVPSLAANPIAITAVANKAAGAADFATLQEFTVEYMG